MTVTNRMGLPESLVRAVETEPHNKDGSLSATTLLKGAKQILLERRHWEELEDDACDRVWAAFGTAVHRLLEEKNPDAFTEESFEVKVSKTKVTGRVDLYEMDKACVTDYKTASVWKVIYRTFDDWRRQGLTYAWLMRKSGLEVDKCRFVALLRDWSATEAGRRADYPQAPAFVYEFKVDEAGLSEIEAFVKEKVALVETSEPLADDDIPPCSPEERWERPTTWAVMKEGRKTALRVFDAKEEADKMADGQKGLSVEERKGACARCEGYCLAARFCSFAKGLKGGKE